MARLYRFTHRAIELVQDEHGSTSDSIEDSTIPAEISLANLTMFSTILFITEFRKMGLGDSVDISKTCNMSEWYRRIYAGTGGQLISDEEEYVDVLTLPSKPTSQAGLIYATTNRPDEEGDKKEAFTAFLFAHHKPALPKTAPSSTGSTQGPSPEAQALVSTYGVTHIWLCGSSPEQRRQRLMSQCLSHLEKDVLEWKTSGQGSGVLTVHTIPEAFPGMVQFLSNNGFKGGNKVVGGDNGKVLYWKEL
ncbi:hypothetical protein BC939DRAFT_436627 [Gamsiella multidivaricata]|uniref:uncharacterized protein n=1 Tax=Gamsiella multidivaricata TaxID=101098 RepID=UPI00221F3E52|nr:uncharacterized protein BC939DRAFT_436627 [Gamsiella multidivaricata]KAG0361269.1 hypothetical protein BGZ54_009158 [Gamsiella multidivaricata]KAI7831800.1 hypothetical protein BC939DRAFT_436627 [Gamsiella multidivaricata]